MGKRASELHTTSIIVTAGQVETDIRTIIDSTVVSPGYTICCREVATSLSLVEIEKIPQQCRPLWVWNAALRG